MNRVLNIYKTKGLTPLEVIRELKNTHEYESCTLSYAGRLDPLADGVLLVLIGEENKNREGYEKLNKSYEFEVLIGIHTDTYDIMGIPHMADVHVDVEKEIKNLKGEKIVHFPPYSSRRVRGHPLFWWARNGLLSQIKVPRHKVKIYETKVIKKRTVTKRELEERLGVIKRVNGEFRQKVIINSWKKFLPTTPQTFAAYTIEISCASGTYVRAIANELGGVALRITRTAVGKWTIEQSLNVSSKVSSPEEAPLL